MQEKYGFAINEGWKKGWPQLIADDVEIRQ
jgi:hypothetical protein